MSAWILWIVAFGGKCFERCLRRRTPEEFSDVRDSHNIYPQMSLSRQMELPVICFMLSTCSSINRTSDLKCYKA